MKVRHIIGWSMLAILCMYWWWAQNSPPPVSVQNDYVPLLTLTDNTTYIYAENGQRASSLHAEYAEHHDNGSGTHFTRPELTHQESADTHYTATAEQGFINDMKDSVELSDDVVVKRYMHDRLVDQLTTNSLIYHPQTSNMITHDPLIFTSQDSRTTATGALWQLNKNSLILKQNIRTHYETTSSQP
ncbi:LPS export ABC transporter periplasmic protein LptC [Cardiobacteriaceae bacterium TAE3-ERU3]|nr:LPS export ABC transporter periplasmic protein LptC [Cardiobacteriaceae bacterium TAE3-ERU3]